MPCSDRKKRLENCKKWREDNKEKIKEEYQANKNGIKTGKNLRYKKRRLCYIEKKLQLKCQKCEENHISCLDFHHLDPKEKEGNISSMVKYSLKKIKKEIEKCIILCSNCHRKLHWDNNRIEKLKKDIKNLEEINNEFIYTRIKKYSNCKVCGRSREEVKFVKRRLFCVDCYRECQKEKMRIRRKIKILKRVEDNKLSQNCMLWVQVPSLI